MSYCLHAGIPSFWYFLLRSYSATCGNVRNGAGGTFDVTDLITIIWGVIDAETAFYELMFVFVA